ncbi:MAG TPA: HepT-like ribonuclease domain-containing protein [Stellaceae bacterium]|nr:HepT-like ribonuclease domain-containing protein [Stellaceae bacterium]
MLSDAAAHALRDIAHHIDLAASFTAGLDYDAFRADLRTVYAVTRCLEIISEASRRLPDD